MITLSTLVLIAACSDTKTAPSAQKTGSTVAPTSSCFDDSQALLEESFEVKEPSLSGDLDGDGKNEMVRAVAKPSQVGCRYFVEVRSGDIVRHLLEFPDWAIPDNHYRLDSLVRLTDDGSLHIAARVADGASIEALAMFAFHEGEIKRMKIEKTRDDIFAYSGSNAFFSGVDCLRTSGHVVSGSAARRKKRYEVERKFYKVSGQEFAIDRRRPSVDYSLPFRRIRFPELKERPFASCIEVES